MNNRTFMLLIGVLTLLVILALVFLGIGGTENVAGRGYLWSNPF